MNISSLNYRSIVLCAICAATIALGMVFAVPVMAENTPIPAYITDGSLFELEGDTPHPLINDTTLEFLPLEAQVATANGNGWRHEYKIDQPHRLPMGATYESFTATYTISMSAGAKSIVSQYHGDSPTLMKLYYADSTEKYVDENNNPVGDSIGKNGIFDLYVRLRTKGLPNFGEDVFHFGTLVAGDTFDLVVVNNYGTVSVTAMGKTVTRELEETATDYLKFGNYLQAQRTDDENHQYGGDKCKDFEPPLGFAECYEYLGITESSVILTNVAYERTVDPDYELPPPDANLELLNGGFEESPSLTKWTQEEPVSISYHFNSGAQSAKISDAPGRLYQRVEVAANTEYELSVYTKGEGAFGVKGTEHINDDATTEIDIMKTFADLGEVWTKQTITFTTGTDPLPVYVYGLHGSSGDVRFDDFSLETETLITDSNFCPSGNAAPASTFDLANWRIKVPDVDGTTYSPSELATLNNDFFCLNDDGAMVFYVPVDGGTDGSTYPRSELREMIDPDSSSVGWVISGTHTMSAETTVTLEPSNGKIVIAQVDSLTDDILAKIQWDNDRIRVQLRQIEPDGSPGSYENYWFDDQNASFPVGKTFDWEMSVEDGVLSVTVDGETVTHDFVSIPAARSLSDYVDDEFYFSAGSQPQDNTLDAAGEAGEVLFHAFDLTHLEPLNTSSIYCPSGNAAPATAFDLANWRIKVPDEAGTTYSPTELATLNNEFFCLSDDGAMVFYVPVAGGTGGSTYPRTELREMIDPSDSNVGWEITGTHKMSAETTVTLEPSNGKIVIAQVDSLTDDILAKIQWDNDRIRVQLRQIEADGSSGSYANYWFDDQNTSFPVGTTFTWDMTVTDGVLTVTVNDETTTHDFGSAESPSDYSDDAFYFSAGSQPQDNVQDDPEGAEEAGEVLFHTFEVSHGEAAEPTSCPGSNGAPATQFDLANWRIKVPDASGTTYSPSELQTLDNEFFCLSDDGAMVMYVPVEGGTGGSTYPRTELREMLDPSSSSVGWPISGTHTLSATTTVTQEPSNGKIVIAQVDSTTDDILAKIQWDNDRIRVQLRQINPDGSPGSYENFWFDSQNTSFPLGTQFSWEMTVEDGVLSVSVNGETTTHDFALLATAPSDYADDEFYFSAGSQPQDNTLDAAGEAAEVLFYSLDVTHLELPATGASGNVNEGQDGSVAFDLTNSGGSEMTYSITEGSCAGGEDYAWLTSIDPATGTVAADDSASISVNIDASGHTKGDTLSGMVCVNASGSRAAIEVAIEVVVFGPNAVSMSNADTVTTTMLPMLTALLIVLLATSAAIVRRQS